MKLLVLGASILVLLFVKNIDTKTYVDLTIEQVKWDFLNDDLHPDISKIKFIKRKGIGQCLVGPFAFIINVTNDNSEIEAKVYKLEGNEFRLTPFKVKRMKICDGIKSDPYFYKQAQEHSTIPEGCPIPAGNYSLDWCPDLSSVPPNFFGKYKIEVTAVHWGRPNTLYTFIGRLERYQVV